MQTTTITQINAPASTVFLWLEDKSRLMQWVPNLTEDEPITETPDKIGSRFRQVFVENGREMVMIGEITAYAENKHMCVDIEGNMFTLDLEYILTALSDTKTELTQHTKIKFKGAAKLMTPLMFLMSKFSKKTLKPRPMQRLRPWRKRSFRRDRNGLTVASNMSTFSNPKIN